MDRKNRPRTRRKKGVSPVIAALLLVAIAVAGAIVTHSWVMSMISNQGEQAQTAIRVDIMEFTGTSNVWINTTIRNVGSVQAVISTVYVTLTNGTVYTQQYASGNTINVGDTMEICFGTSEAPTDFAWTPNTAYKIKMITDNGFAVEGNYKSPSS